MLFIVLLIVLLLLINCNAIILKSSSLKTLRNALCFTAINLQLISSYPVISNAETSQQQQYGLKKGRLLVCKQKSNCISSSSITSLDGKYGIPWTYNKDTKDVYNELVNTIKSNKLLKLVDTNDENYYVHAEAKSAVPPTGIDDIEFLLNPIDKIITYRSKEYNFSLDETRHQ